MNGLKSLCQLFLGRKYDPIQNRIDRLHYSNQKLFLGILTFTISFFLVPTTIVYYIVFTLVSYTFEYFSRIFKVKDFNNSFFLDKIGSDVYMLHSGINSIVI